MAAEKVTLINRDILTVFKDMVWQASDGSPVTHKVSELVQSGKRIIVENMREYFANPSEGDAVVFYPALWAGHQFSGNSMTEFPACAVEGDTAWYGQKQIRALDGSFTEAATRCGVQVVSGDYTNPDDMKMFVWSWDQAEPSVSTANGGCVAMLPSGRWATLDCSLELPYACLPTDDNGAGLRWNVDLNRTRAWTTDLPCPVGYSFAAPHNGFANSVLLNIAVGQTTWLNAPNPLR